MTRRSRRVAQRAGAPIDSPEAFDEFAKQLMAHNPLQRRRSLQQQVLVTAPPTTAPRAVQQQAVQEQAHQADLLLQQQQQLVAAAEQQQRDVEAARAAVAAAAAGPFLGGAEPAAKPAALPHRASVALLGPAELDGILLPPAELHVAAPATTAAQPPAAGDGGGGCGFAAPRPRALQQVQQQEAHLLERRLSTAVSIGATISAAPDAIMPPAPAAMPEASALGKPFCAPLGAATECPGTVQAAGHSGAAAAGEAVPPATAPPPSTIHADTWRSLVELGVASPPTGKPRLLAGCCCRLPQSLGLVQPGGGGKGEALLPCTGVWGLLVHQRCRCEHCAAVAAAVLLQATPQWWAPLSTWALSRAAWWPPRPCCCLERCSRAGRAAAAGCALAAACGGEEWGGTGGHSGGALAPPSARLAVLCCMHMCSPTQRLRGVSVTRLPRRTLLALSAVAAAAPGGSRSCRCCSQ